MIGLCNILKIKEKGDSHEPLPPLLISLTNFLFRTKTKNIAHRSKHISSQLSSLSVHNNVHAKNNFFSTHYQLPFLLNARQLASATSSPGSSSPCSLSIASTPQNLFSPKIMTTISTARYRPRPSPKNVDEKIMTEEVDNNAVDSNVLYPPPPPPPPPPPSLESDSSSDTQLKHIVFGIAASLSLWKNRKEYIKLWWKPGEARGVVWLDNKVNTSTDEGLLPEIPLSENTARFEYTHRQGKRAALRISRVVSETLRLGVKDVRWLVMGDDDPVFTAENLLRVLNKYDHNGYYYIGSSSESHVQNIFFSYNMAYGGGGFAISYPLAVELEKMQDQCLQRYPGLYGSDDRIQACMAELGVPLTKENSFHQVFVSRSTFSTKIP